MIEDKKISSVLLLTMSTLSFKRDSEGKTIPLSENYYKYRDTYVSGYGQLEPIPKMLIQKIKNLDEIIIIASEDSRKEIDFEIEIRNPDGTINTETKRESAVSFFKEQLKSVKSDLLFKVIEIKKSKNSEDNILIGPIEEVVDELRTLKNKNADLTLYLDMHGGQRQNQLVMDAIISLLKIEDIKVTETYSCDGYSNDINNPKEIQNADEALKIFDFVAGMNEFINYGSSKSLEKFINDNEPDNKEFMRLIVGVSNSLKLCDIENFENGLDEIYKFCEKPMTGYMGIFRDEIKRDYTNDLLDKKERTLIKELNWALKKGFIQQCLAIVESKSAEYFVKLFLVRETGVVRDENGRRLRFDFFIDTIKKSYERDKSSIFMNYIVNAVTQNQPSEISVDDTYLVAVNEKGGGYEVRIEYENIAAEDLVLILKLWTAIKKIRNQIMHTAGLEITAPRTIQLLNELFDFDISCMNNYTISFDNIRYLLEQYVGLWNNLMSNDMDISSRFGQNTDQLMNSLFPEINVIGNIYNAIIAKKGKGKTWINLDNCPVDDRDCMNIAEKNPGDGFINTIVEEEIGACVVVRLIKNASQCEFEIV